MSQWQRRTGDQWREIISAQPTSGLSIAAYCRQQRISQPSFFIWRRRLAAGADGAAFVEVKTPAAEAKPTARRGTLEGTPSRLDAGIELRLRGGRRLRVRRGFDRGILLDLIDALERKPSGVENRP